jgi:hypothetical protein
MAMGKPKLYGYWISKENPNIKVFVERVYKSGHVTGFKYEKLPNGGELIHPPFKATWEELQEKFEREEI